MNTSNAQRAPLYRRGGGLVEVLVVTGILLVLFGAIGMAVSTGTKAYEQGIAGAEVEGQARRMVERIAGELMDASRASLVFNPPRLANNSAFEIRFQRGEGWAAGLQLGPQREIRLVYAPGEANDGVDNNGNGLVDECRLELRPDVVGAPGQAVGWGGFVREFLQGETPNAADDNGNGVNDERGLCLTFDPLSNTLTIRLTLERRRPDGALITRTVETAVLVRNS